MISSIRARPGTTSTASILAELADAQGADVTQLEPGRAGVGEAVKAGLLLPLTEAYTAYGWGDRWAPRTLDRIRFADDGSDCGSGTLYGVPVTGELVGLMFNDVVGHTRQQRAAPRTLEEDMADYITTREDGIVPIVVGAADGDMLHVYGSILGSLVTPEWLDDFVYGRGGATFDTPETVAAAEMLADIAVQGFFTQGFEAMSSAEALQRFIANKAQFLATGSWTWPALKATGAPFMFSRWHPRTAGRDGPVGRRHRPPVGRAERRQPIPDARPPTWTSSRATTRWSSSRPTSWSCPATSRPVRSARTRRSGT